MVLRAQRCPLALLCLGLAWLAGLPGIGWAQAGEAGDAAVITEQLETAQDDIPPETEEIAEVAGEPVLGLVREIEITGAPSVRDSVIRRQLSFKIGDTIRKSDLDRSHRLLRRLGLFTTLRLTTHPIDAVPVDADSEPSAESAEASAEVEPDKAAPGPIRVRIQVWQGNSYYLYPVGRTKSPYVIGGTFGDRDAFQTGDDLSVTWLESGSTRQLRLAWSDPQFGGGHHRGSIALTRLETGLAIRTEENPSTNERYDLSRAGIEFNRRTTHNDRYRVRWGVSLERIRTESRQGMLTAEDPDVYARSGASIADGNLLLFDVGISDSATRGWPLVYEGWSWDLRTRQSFAALGSLATYGVYSARGSYLWPLDKRNDAFGIGIRLDTSTGDPPHFDAPRAGPRIRGYTGIDYHTQSAITINTEFRIMLPKEKGQVVLFYDMGKGYDQAIPGIDGWESAYGVGLRLRTKDLLPVDYLLLIDFGFGEDGTELKLGLGQWF